MKRICCFCESWESGGIESFLHNVLLHMDLSEMEVDIVASSVRKSIFTADLAAKGIRFVELSGNLRNLKNVRLFRQLLRDRKYDVVHFNLFQGLSLYYVQIAKEEGVPVRIAHSHNTTLRKSMGRMIKLVLHSFGVLFFSGAATDWWACSRAAAEFLFSSKILKQKGFRFIPNGIETAKFRFDKNTRDSVRSKLGLTDSFVIGHVGRLCYQKNQEFLLDVFVEVLKRSPESRLLLIGEGEKKSRLKEKASELGISEKVVFFGVTDRVEQLMWAMDVFAFPSLFEGLGIVAVEAQAAGLPVVCSEYIPKEAMATRLASRCEIGNGIAAWADCLLKNKDCGLETRESANKDICMTGFDIQDTVSIFSSVFQMK